MDEPIPPRVPRNILQKFGDAIHTTLDKPVTWFRETVVVPNRPEHVYYHQKFRRVPTIDECYTDDAVCRFEAQAQFNRDKIVDAEIVSLVRQRLKECIIYESPDHIRKCKKLKDDFDLAAENYFIKYGDLGPYNNVLEGYMKQKHRMIWERRHGEVGSGMKNQDTVA
nr:EOG090X0LTN [Eurycercus lamellatus]